MNKIMGALALSVILSMNPIIYEGDNMIKEPCLIMDRDNEFRNITESEFELICKCVATEGRGESNECQEAIATVILNRWMNPEKFPNTIAGVIYEDGQFAINESIEYDVGIAVAVKNAITFYNTDLMCLPYQTYYFRAGHYHRDLGMPYMSIDNTYFSIDENAIVD